MIVLPRLYAILDPSCFQSSDQMLKAAEEWVNAGATLLQYRNKSGDARTMLADAKALKETVVKACVALPCRTDNHPLGETRAGWGSGEDSRPHVIQLIMNDRADLCLAAEFDGVHVGQDDLSPESARKIAGPSRWVGVSTHNPEQVAAADLTTADYLAIGPVFATASKVNPDPVVGLDGVRHARSLTRKPLVAIGGITRQNCQSVIQAGADSVAVISDLVREPGKSVEEFLRILG